MGQAHQPMRAYNILLGAAIAIKLYSLVRGRAEAPIVRAANVIKI